jgi:hypothetical protein
LDRFNFTGNNLENMFLVERQVSGIICLGWKMKMSDSCSLMWLLVSHYGNWWTPLLEKDPQNLDSILDLDSHGPPAPTAVKTEHLPGCSFG